MEITNQKYNQIIDMVDNSCNFGEILEESDYTRYELLLMIYKMINDRVKVPYHIKYNLIQEYLNNFSFADLSGKKTIIISDTHLSSIYDNLEYLKQVNDFIKQKNINYLLHAGDIGDGMVKYKKECNSYNKQIDYILNNYPEFSNCTQYMLGGNHDRRYKDKNLDILKLLESKKNIEGVGYYQAYFKLFDRNVSLEHNSHMNNDKFIKKSFSILGHSHNTSFKEKKLSLPTLSLDLKDKNSKSGFIVMDSKRKKQAVELTFEQYSLEGDELNREKTKKYILK